MLEISRILTQATERYGFTPAQGVPLLGGYFSYTTLSQAACNRLYVMLYQGYDPNDTESWVGRFMSGRKLRIESDIPFVEIDFGLLVE